MKDKIIKALEKVRPMLQADGGDLEFSSFDEKKGVLEIRLLGMCSHCPMAHFTLKEGIEKEIKKAVPEVKTVKAV
jgi:Fe-S cluster biogenesis protein NfuA